MNTAVVTFWTTLVPLAQQAPDPEDVKPGWLGFGVFLALVAAVVVLVLSFRKQLRKVNFPESRDQGPTQDTSPGDGEERPR